MVFNILMILVDVHAHLDWKDFENELDEIIKRAENAGVKAIITAGVDMKSNRKALDIAEKYDIVKAAIGLYPPDALSRETNSDINENVDEELKFIETNKDKIIAIGEIGLDFLSEKSDLKFQMETFVKQLKLAKKLNLPVIVHSRKAEADVINILEKENMKKVVMHCFCGKKRLIKKAIEMGWYFSIPTNVVKSQQFQDMVEMIPLQQLLTETDAPFLSPYQGLKNEPAFISEAIKKIAFIKKIEQEELANIIFNNFQRLFL
ncbi:MAG: TatD family hydrolase [bacterium]